MMARNLGSSSISEEIEAASSITWPEPVVSTSSTGSIAYAVAHPTTFIEYDRSNYDWYYTGSSDTDNTYDTVNGGFNFGSTGEGSRRLADADVCWYPAAG